MFVSLVTCELHEGRELSFTRNIPEPSTVLSVDVLKVEGKRERREEGRRKRLPGPGKVHAENMKGRLSGR